MRDDEGEDKELAVVEVVERGIFRRVFFWFCAFRLSLVFYFLDLFEGGLEDCQ